MQRSYSSHVQLTKVHEGGEPAQFKALFAVWERECLPGQIKPVTSRIGQYRQFVDVFSDVCRLATRDLTHLTQFVSS